MRQLLRWHDGRRDRLDARADRCDCLLHVSLLRRRVVGRLGKANLLRFRGDRRFRGDLDGDVINDLHHAQVLGFLSGAQNQIFLFLVGNKALVPNRSFVDSHVDVETFKSASLLFYLQFRHNVAGDLLIVCRCEVWNQRCHGNDQSQQ